MTLQIRKVKTPERLKLIADICAFIIITTLINYAIFWPDSVMKVFVLKLCIKAPHGLTKQKILART